MDGEKLPHSVTSYVMVGLSAFAVHPARRIGVMDYQDLVFSVQVVTRSFT